VREYPFQLRVGTHQHDLFTKDVAHIYRTTLPFLKKWALVPDNYNEIYQQALSDLQSPDFDGSWTILTVSGTTPVKTDDPFYLEVR
jgi:hypothetical protein